LEGYIHRGKGTSLAPGTPGGTFSRFWEEEFLGAKGGVRGVAGSGGGEDKEERGTPLVRNLLWRRDRVLGQRFEKRLRRNGSPRRGVLRSSSDREREGRKIALASVEGNTRESSPGHEGEETGEKGRHVFVESEGPSSRGKRTITKVPQSRTRYTGPMLVVGRRRRALSARMFDT